MTLNRFSILIAILLVAGILFTMQTFNQRVEPLYGYAVFGARSEQSSPQATGSNVVSDQLDADSFEENRAHFIVVGRDVYFDANKNKIPERPEKFDTNGTAFQVASLDGQSRYRLTKAVVGLSPDNVSEAMPQHIILNVDVHEADQPESINFQQTGMITVHPLPVEHGWAHFDGPLSFEFFDDGLALPASDGPTVDLRLAISTPRVKCTIPAGKKFCSNATTTVPGMLVPTASIEFPTLADEAITKRYDLDQFC